MSDWLSLSTTVPSLHRHDRNSFHERASRKKENLKMKKIFVATAMLLMSSTGAYAAAPESVSKAAASCCSALAACCQAVMACCG
jgi:hypothetical protein